MTDEIKLFQKILILKSKILNLYAFRTEVETQKNKAIYDNFTPKGLKKQVFFNSDCKASERVK